MRSVMGGETFASLSTTPANARMGPMGVGIMIGGLGVMAPGVLRTVGDVAHLAALNAPRRVVIAGGVSGKGEPLVLDLLREAYQPATTAWKLANAPRELVLLGDGAPANVIEALR